MISGQIISGNPTVRTYLHNFRNTVWLGRGILLGVTRDCWLFQYRFKKHFLFSENKQLLTKIFDNSTAQDFISCLLPDSVNKKSEKNNVRTRN